MSPGEQFLAKLDLDQNLLLVYTTRNCRSDAGKWKIGAELFGIVGGTKDNPDQILEILLSNAVPSRVENLLTDRTSKRK